MESRLWRIRQHPAPRAQAPASVAPNASRSCCAAPLALGLALIVLIGLVLGVKGCLDAQAQRALTDYARDVDQIVEETEPDQQDVLRQALKTRATSR